MKDSGVDQFPGFQIYSHREEFEFRRCMSRLQKRAPCPLQLKPNNVISISCSVSQESVIRAGSGSASSSSSSSTSSTTSSSFNSFFSSKDPIPLLSPLVVLESTCIGEENTAKSH